MLEVMVVISLFLLLVVFMACKESRDKTIEYIDEVHKLQKQVIGLERELAKLQEHPPLIPVTGHPGTFVHSVGGEG